MATRPPVREWKEEPRLYALIEGHPHKPRRELNLEREMRQGRSKLAAVLHSSKQVFSLAHNLMQLVNSLRTPLSHENLEEAIDGFKRQLAKYHRVLQLEGRPDSDPPTEVVMIEHKQRLDKHWGERNMEGLT